MSQWAGCSPDNTTLTCHLRGGESEGEGGRGIHIAGGRLGGGGGRERGREEERAGEREGEREGGEVGISSAVLSVCSRTTV